MPPLGSPLRVPDTRQVRDRGPLRCLLPACLVYQPVGSPPHQSRVCLGRWRPGPPVFGSEAGREPPQQEAEKRRGERLELTPCAQRLGWRSHLISTSRICTPIESRWSESSEGLSFREGSSLPS